MTPICALYEAIRSSGPFRYAPEMHDEVAALARRLDWGVSREVAQPYQAVRGPVRGRIDLVVSHRATGDLVAIELDRLWPRARSMRKLEAFACTDRFVVMRGPWEPRRMHGVLTFGLKTHEARQ